MANTGLCRKMQHARKTMITEQRRRPYPVCKIEFDELESRQFRKFCKSRVFERGIIVAVEIIDTDHRSAGLRQPARHMESNEAGRASYKYFVRHRSPSLLRGHEDQRRHSSMPCGCSARSSFDLTSSTM